MKWRKTGDARWLSHLDIARAWQRAFIRAEVPVKYSEGFSPHQKVAFSPALPVGTAGHGEYMDVRLENEIDIKGIADDINGRSPDGLRIVAAATLADGVPSLNSAVSVADYEVLIGPLSEKSVLLARSSLTDCLTDLIGTAKKVDERAVALSLGELFTDEGGVRFKLRVPIQIRPRTFLEAISELCGTEVKTRSIDRVALWVLVNGKLADPLEVGAAKS